MKQSKKKSNKKPNKNNKYNNSNLNHNNQIKKFKRVSKKKVPVFYINSQSNESNNKVGNNISNRSFKSNLINKMLETDATILMFMNIYKLNKSDGDILNILKSMRNKNYIIPDNYKDKDLELFHLKFKEFITSVINKINNDYNNKINPYIVDLDENDEKYLKMKKKTKKIIDLNEKTKLEDINKFLLNLSKKNKKSRINKNLKGGGNAYLGRLINKGQEPITGDDIAQSVQEIGEFLQNLRYTPEGNGSTGFQVLFDLFTGNDMSLQYYLKFNLLPKYASILPPKIRMSNIYPQLESIAEYLTLYTSYRRTVRQGKLETGELTEEDLKPDAIDKLAEKAMTARYALLKASYVKNPQTLLLM